MEVVYFKLPINFTCGEAIKMIRERWDCVYIGNGVIAVNYYENQNKLIEKLLTKNGFEFKNWDLHIEGWEPIIIT
jgi:hypothetical protein